jgi:beta-lactamase class A
MITRRRFAVSAGLAAAAAVSAPAVLRAAPPAAETLASETLAAALARIERESGGRLGVAVRDTGAGLRAGHREDERFPLCSTFKLVAAAAVLARVDAGRERLDRRVAIPPRDGLVTYSPVTERHAGEEMTLEALCEAAMMLSDNTAGNLLLEAIGGPAGLTDFARSLGDPVTRLDRIEPFLNESAPGDPRDTTTPAAMLETVRRLALGDALAAGSREKLVVWMVGNRTGDARLRAGVPAGWRVGDKTGTGDRGTANDVGVIWPPGRPPVVVAVYLTETEAAPAVRNVAHAAVARAVVAAIGA